MKTLLQLLIVTSLTQCVAPAAIDTPLSDSDAGVDEEGKRRDRDAPPPIHRLQR